MEEFLSVSELTSAIKKQLESRFPLFQLKAEVSNLKSQASGHLYFTLKDKEAQISAVLFRGYAKNLSRPLKEGDQVLIQGEVNVYAPRGYYQVVARSLSFVGVGELLAELHALKARLELQGWFAQERKKPIPKVPKTIGVVTSATGSVIQDILNVLSRRFSQFHLILNPVKVQGEGSAEEIAAAIDDFNRHGLAEVLIVGRGGGSVEDLWAFNQEVVARAIYESKIPIISAVGHETDFSISDFTADLRAPTPSAAAEMVSLEAEQQLHFLKGSRERMKGFVITQLGHYRRQLERFKRHPLLASPLSLLEPHCQRVDLLRAELSASLERAMTDRRGRVMNLERMARTLKPQAQIGALREKLKGIELGLDTAMRQRLTEKKQLLSTLSAEKHLEARLKEKLGHLGKTLSALAAHLKGIDPKNLLKQGYSILFRENGGSVILSSSELSAGEKVRLQLSDGNALLTVNEVNR